MISIIAAIGKNNELGKDNKLVFRIKEDMQFFKTTTTGHPVIMGKKTFESIGGPLPHRTNYVAAFSTEDLPSTVCAVNDLHQFLKSHQDTDEEVFVIGGATIYREALPYANTIYLTEIDANADADAFFPDFNRSDYSREVIRKGKEDDLNYAFVKYSKK